MPVRQLIDGIRIHFDLRSAQHLLFPAVLLLIEDVRNILVRNGPSAGCAVTVKLDEDLPVGNGAKIAAVLRHHGGRRRADAQVPVVGKRAVHEGNAVVDDPEFARGHAGHQAHRRRGREAHQARRVAVRPATALPRAAVWPRDVVRVRASLGVSGAV